MGGTLSTTIFTAVKFVPKKKTVSSNAASTGVEARCFDVSPLVTGCSGQRTKFVSALRVLP
jgi:hypothetical protein